MGEDVNKKKGAEDGTNISDSTILPFFDCDINGAFVSRRLDTESTGIQ